MRYTKHLDTIAPLTPRNTSNKIIPPDFFCSAMRDPLNRMGTTSAWRLPSSRTLVNAVIAMTSSGPASLQVTSFKMY